MKLHLTCLSLCLLALLAVGIPASAEDGAHAMPAAPTSPDFDRFKALAGTWEGTVTHEGEPQPATVTYAVTAGGSAVAETLFQGTPHEMLTVFYVANDALTLTHYCMLGNQPQMRAKAAGGTTVSFAFDGGANIADPGKDMHMHEASYTFEGPDRLRATWTMYNEGAPAGQAVIELTRKTD